jgi:hypothetical protein
MLWEICITLSAKDSQMDRRYVILGGCALLFCTHLFAENEDPALQLAESPDCSNVFALVEDRRTDVGEALHVEPRAKSYSAKQKKLYRKFTESSETADREQTASILSELWRENRLRKNIKNGLLDRHYRFVLRQIDGEYQRPNFDVRCSQTFAFPDVWIHFTPTLYINGEVVWAPKKPQRSHAMSLSDSTITSRTGGPFNNGDIVQYQIRMHHEVDEEVVWTRTLWTNRVVVEGLKQ